MNNLVTIMTEVRSIMDEINRTEDEMWARIAALTSEEVARAIRLEIERAKAEQLAHERRLKAARKRLAEEMVALGADMVHSGPYVARLVTRVSWDTRGLEGYARAHPEVMEFRRESQYVRIARSDE